MTNLETQNAKLNAKVDEVGADVLILGHENSSLLLAKKSM